MVVGKYHVKARVYIGRIPWRARMEVYCVLAVFEYVAAFAVYVGAGASINDVSFALIAATNGRFSRMVTDKRASLVDFEPLPRASESRPNPRSSKTSCS
jgi:hypothetical protein